MRWIARLLLKSNYVKYWLRRSETDRDMLGLMSYGDLKPEKIVCDDDLEVWINGHTEGRGAQLVIYDARKPGLLASVELSEHDTDTLSWSILKRQTSLRLPYYDSSFRR